ncbi:MAG TPA: hypothetical protein VN878_02065 [Usitatibacter sp.]|nr:hypothetical protein [Usitatibacter sp.]
MTPPPFIVFCGLLTMAALPATALERPPDQLVGAGSMTCSQYRKTLDEYRGVLRREQMDVVKILEASIQYANFEGTLGGYLARAQMDRGAKAAPDTREEAMEQVYRICAKTPEARFIDAVAQYVEVDLASKRAPATASLAAPSAPPTPAAVRMPANSGQSTTPPGSPIPIQLDATAQKTWEVVGCEAAYSSMDCTLRNISSTDAKGGVFASRAITADGITVASRSPIFYDTLRPGATIRADFGLGAASYKAVIMEIFAK